MLTNDPSVKLYQARRHELRSLVDSYYTIQELRKGAGNKERSYRQGYDLPSANIPIEDSNDMDASIVPEPLYMQSIKGDLEAIEGRIGKYLEKEAEKEELGRWCMSIDGIGGALAAGLLAFIDFHRCCCDTYRHFKGKERKDIPIHDCYGLPTAGCIWSFAGLRDKEQQPWLPGTKRPYNVRLKTHCWKISDQFRRQSVNQSSLSLSIEQMMDILRKDKKGSIRQDGKVILYRDMDDLQLSKVAQSKQERMQKRVKKLEDRLYVRLYQERKARDTMYNEQRRFQKQASEMLANARKKKLALSKETLECWKDGRITPGGVDLRAMKHAATMFISHYHQIGREIYFGEKVVPWIIKYGQHGGYIPPPNWPMQ